MTTAKLAMKYRTLTAALAVMWFAAPSAADAYKCDYLPQEPAPVWISAAPVEEKLYVGVGSAEKADSSTQQMEKSLNNALGRVVKEVSVTVKNAFIEKTSESTAGFSRKAAHAVEDVLEVNASALLHDVSVKARWLDRDSCTLWTMITVPKESVIANKRFTVMKALYEASRKAMPAEALEMLAEAKNLLPQINFAYIHEMNDRRYYEQLIAKAMDALREDVGIKKTLLLTLLRKNAENIEIPAAATKKISSGVAEVYPSAANMADAGCANDQQCIETAKQSGAEKLVLVNIEGATKQNQLGSYKGILTVEVNEYNVKTRTRTKTFMAKSEVITPFTKDDLDWNLAAQKLLDSGKLNELTGEH